jgi:putative Ca2+/H+ antiporter (TMEM165/GDT1 family)
MPLETFVTSFGLILLMELGDKTMLTIMCLSSQYRRPRLVLLAAMTALTTSSIIAVIVGYLLSATLPIEIIKYVSGFLFLAMGLFALMNSNTESIDNCDNPSTLFGMFSLVFFSELGDKSQIVILALATESLFPLEVLAGAILGFLVVNFIGILAGDKVAEHIPLKTVKRIVGAVFLLFGLLVILGIL